MLKIISFSSVKGGNPTVTPAAVSNPVPSLSEKPGTASPALQTNPAGTTSKPYQATGSVPLQTQFSSEPLMPPFDQFGPWYPYDPAYIYNQIPQGNVFFYLCII